MSAPFPQLPQLSLAMHGLDPAAIRVSDVPPGGERIRRTIAWAASTKVRAFQLDATAPGIRPRELDRSGRRDLAALLRRSELLCSGVDCFVPPDHFTNQEHVDRAVSAVLGAIELAAELATLSSGAIVSRMNPGEAVVHVHLSPKSPADIRKALAAKAETCGVRLADVAWPVPDLDKPSGGGGVADAPLGVGIDPAQTFAAGNDPTKLVSTLGPRLTGARLSDLSRGLGVSRVAPGSGQGRLDVLGYLVALATSSSVRHVVLDLRSLPEPDRAVDIAREACASPF